MDEMTGPSEPIDTSAQAADRAWFAERIDGLLPDLYGRALRLCRHSADAEDLVAEAVAKGWEKLPTLQERDAFQAWMFRILNNTYFSARRTARAQAHHEPLDDGGAEFSLFEHLHQPILLWWGNPETEFLNRLLRADLESAIDALPDPFREVVVLIDVQGLAYREVAALLDIPLGTVRSRLARGRGMLQQALWQHGREAGLTSDATRPEQERPRT